MSDLTREQIEACMSGDWPTMLRHREDAPLFRTLCTMALRALDAGWRSMESAPRDGTAVLVTTSTLDENDRRIMAIGCVHGDDFDDEDDCMTDEDGLPLDGEPLAWMPLPPPFTGDPDARRTVEATEPGTCPSCPLKVGTCPECNGTGRAKGGE